MIWTVRTWTGGTQKNYKRGAAASAAAWFRTLLSVNVGHPRVNALLLKIKNCAAAGFLFGDAGGVCGMGRSVHGQECPEPRFVRGKTVGLMRHFNELCSKWINGIIKSCRCSAVAIIFVFLPAAASAVQPSDGFFFGIEMDPVGDASITALETEPAVALIFAADQKTAGITRQFNEWYNSPSRPAVEVYAIAVEPGDVSREVLVEAINQRDLQMPVFLARSDMLLGDDFRLVVLNEDREVQRFTTLDVAGVYAALSGLGIAVPELPAPTPAVAPPAPPSVPPAPADPPVVVAPAPTVTPVDPSVDDETAVTNPVILGGPGGDSLYVNQVYGMSIEFPPDWRYQIAAQRDGAVAFEPQGSKMDMRLWAMPAGGMDSPQEYVDQTLEALAEKNGTRVNVERKFQVTEDGVTGLDVTYNYTRLLDAAVPARGGLLYRGRMQVFVDNGTIKAARVAAPSGEFRAFFPIIDAYILSFQSTPPEIPAPAGRSSPNNI